MSKLSKTRISYEYNKTLTEVKKELKERIK